MSDQTPTPAEVICGALHSHWGPTFPADEVDCCTAEALAALAAAGFMVVPRPDDQTVADIERAIKQALTHPHEKGYRTTSDEVWDRSPVCMRCGFAWPCDVADVQDVVRLVERAFLSPQGDET